ncbi:PEP-CTERM sorting domain-containing protein [Verrucomicrobiaceae bacterium R5-34]|nr:PEP-CTERM sorting domain-containing protein [Verrucomicrobiaceae bacterium R5-34]
MSHTTLSIASSLLIISTVSLPAALSLETYLSASHHRFTNDAAFIGATQDWSGVGIENGGSYRWATMISSTYFISAEHAAPTVGNDIVFHTDNNPAGSTVTREVLSITQVGSTDLVIGKLSSAPGPTVAIYAISATPTTSLTFGSSVYSDREAYVVGRDAGASTTSFRVGRNELDGFGSFSDFPTVGDAITFDDDAFSPESLGADEAYLIGGDSGAPLFTTVGSDLVLTGVNWFNNPASGGDPRYSGATFVPNYITEINALLAVDGESLTLVTVPEPSSLALLSLAGFALITRRKLR